MPMTMYEITFHILEDTVALFHVQLVMKLMKWVSLQEVLSQDQSPF